LSLFALGAGVILRFSPICHAVAEVSGRTRGGAKLGGINWRDGAGSTVL